MASEGRVAIVTGGNKGMGMSIIRDLVQRGWQVAIADIMENQEFAEELGEKASFFKCDVTDYDSQAAMYQGVWDKYHRLDAVCMNAGVVDQSSIFAFDYRGRDTIPPKPNLLCTDVDYKGVVYGTRLATHFMRKNKSPGGKIVVTASVAGVVPHESFPEYCGAKAAVINFVRATARLLKTKENISINSVCPGIVPTTIIPQAMIDAVSPECLTPQSTIVSAYRLFLDDETLFGKTVECSAEKILFLETPSLANGHVSQRAVTVYEPLFETMHKERSGLPDTVG